MKGRLKTLSAALVLGACWQTASAAEPAYRVDGVITPPNDTQLIEAAALNDAGAVVGLVELAGDGGAPHPDGSEEPAPVRKAFIWRDGSMSFLGSGDDADQGGWTSVGDINTAGQIVGARNGRAVMWQDGGTVELPAFDDARTPIANAHAINDQGQVVGQSRTQVTLPDDTIDQNVARAVLWDGGAPMDLGTLPNAASPQSHAVDINNNGQIVGQARVPEDRQDNAPLTYTTHGFFLDNGTMIDLGGLSEDARTVVEAINDAGQVVGFTEILGPEGERQERAYLWENGGMMGLGTLPGDRFSVGLDIDNHGRVVGASAGEDSGLRGFVWSSQAGMRDINSMIAPSSVDASSFHVEVGEAINERGQILARARVDGELRFMLLSPVSADTGGDDDGDGIANADDQCPGTSAETATNADGCSLDQLVPCSGPSADKAWPSKRWYLVKLARTAREFVRDDIISRDEMKVALKEAARGSCKS